MLLCLLKVKESLPFTKLRIPKEVTEQKKIPPNKPIRHNAGVIFFFNSAFDFLVKEQLNMTEESHETAALL